MTSPNAHKNLDLYVKVTQSTPNAHSVVDLYPSIAAPTKKQAHTPIDLYVTAGPTAYESAVMADTPAVYHRLQETSGTVLTDSANPSTPLNATAQSGVVVNDVLHPAAPGILGGHVRTNGTSTGYISLNNTNWFAPATGGWAIEFWCYVPTTEQVGRKTLFAFSNTKNTTADDLFLDFGTNASNNGARLLIKDTVTTAETNWTEFAPLTQDWHHIVISQNVSSNVVSVYRDAVLVSEKVMALSPNNARQYKWFGRHNNTKSAAYINASFTHIAVYNHPLTSTRVQAHYDASGAKARTTHYLGVLTQDSPTFLYSLEETSGTTFTSLFNNRTATLTGSLTTYAISGPKTNSKGATFPHSTATYLRDATANSQLTGSLEAWVYLTANPAGLCDIITQGDAATGTGNNERGLYITTGGNVGFVAYNGSGYNTATSSSALTLNAWHHIVGTTNQLGHVKVYVDGSVAGSATGTATRAIDRAFYIHGGYNNAGGAVRIALPASYPFQMAASTVTRHYSASPFFTLVGLKPENVDSLAGDSSSQVWWDSVGRVTSYEYRLNGGSNVSTSSTSNYTFIAGLDNASDNSVEVRAVNSVYGETSDWSDPISLYPDATLTQHSEVFKDAPSIYLPMQEHTDWTAPFESKVDGVFTTIDTLNFPTRELGKISRLSEQSVSTTTAAIATLPFANFPALSSTTLTVELWVDLPTSNYSGCFFSVGTTNGFKLGIGNTNTVTAGRQLIIATGSGTTYTQTGWTFPTTGKTRFHLSVHKVANAYTVYVDGYPVYTNSSISTTAATTQMHIGAGSAAATQVLSTDIHLESLSVYTTDISPRRTIAHVLSSADIANLDPTHSTSKVHSTQDGAFMYLDYPYATISTPVADDGDTQTPLHVNYQYTVLQDHPDIYYRHGEFSGTTCFDSSGNGRNATYSGSYSLGEPSPISDDAEDPDSGIYLPGNGGASLPHASFPTISTAFTAEAWIKPTTLSPVDGTGVKHIIGKYNSNNSPAAAEWSWGLRTNGANLEVVLFPASGSLTTLTTTGNPLVENVWQHVAVTYSNNEVRLYINGEQYLTAAYTSALAASANAPLTIGLAQTTALNFKGSIDETAVYTYPLSDHQIRRRYLSASGYFYPRHAVTLPSLGVEYTMNTVLSNPLSPDTYSYTYPSTAIPANPKQAVIVDHYSRWPISHPGHADYAPASYQLAGGTIPGISPLKRLMNRGSASTANGVGNAAIIPNVPANLDETIKLYGTYTDWYFWLVRYLSATDVKIYMAYTNGGSASNVRYRWITPDNTYDVISVPFRVMPTTVELKAVTYNDSIYAYRDGLIQFVGNDQTYNPRNSYSAGMAFYDSNAVGLIDDYIVYTQPDDPVDSILPSYDAFLYKGRAEHDDDAPKYEP